MPGHLTAAQLNACAEAALHLRLSRNQAALIVLSADSPEIKAAVEQEIRGQAGADAQWIDMPPFDPALPLVPLIKALAGPDRVVSVALGP